MSFHIKYKSKKDAILHDILGKLPLFDRADPNPSSISQLEKVGAGLFLGTPHELFEVKIVTRDSSNGYISEVSTGYFGEIIFRNKNFSSWTFSGIIGFSDQNNNIWCCSKQSDVITLNGDTFFPYCIETVFESSWFVKRSALIGLNGIPAIVIEPPFLIKKFSFILEGFLIKKIEIFLKRMLKLKKIDKIFLISRMPLLENSGDIDRQKLAKLLCKK